MDSRFADFRSTSLMWLPEHGMGHYPVSAADEQVYDEGYWQKYESYAASALGRALTAARVALVERHLQHDATIVDVGIGCGDFLNALRGRGWDHAYGMDVNRIGVQWLEALGLNGARISPDAYTFWDAIEHLDDPSAFVARADKAVFVSLPIFRDGYHVLTSRHYRKDEHRWYWTRDGFIKWMASLGFRCAEHSTEESLLGREDIHTFAFLRT
jgi:hypothetical protein